MPPSFGLESNYDKRQWYYKPKNLVVPGFIIGVVTILVFSTAIEEYHKEVEKHRDMLAAQVECERNPPKSAHNTQSCWEAHAHASKSPWAIALSNTGFRMFSGIIYGIQTIGKSYIFSGMVALTSALFVYWITSARDIHYPLFTPQFPHFFSNGWSPQLMLNQQHQNGKHVPHECPNEISFDGPPINNVNLFSSSHTKYE